MSLSARDFTLPGQWAKEANTTIPPIPISGQPYRNAALAKAAIENGQNYDNIADSSDWNQLMYLASGMALESEKYGIPRWSPLTDYAGGASIAIGVDGIPYRAMLDSGPSGAGPRDPTTTTGYWQTLSRYLGVLPTPTVAQTFYLRNDGNDANDGLSDSPGRAFRTLQGAYNAIAKVQGTNTNSIALRITTGGEFGNADGSAVTINPGHLTASVLSIYGNQNGPTISTVGNSSNNNVNCLRLVGSGTVQFNSVGDGSVPELILNFNPVSIPSGSISVVLYSSDVDVTINTSMKLNITPNPAITSGICFIYANNGSWTVANLDRNMDPVTVTLAGRSNIYSIYFTGGAQLRTGSSVAGSFGTEFNVDGITGGATFLYLNVNGIYLRNAVAPTVFTGDQSGIGRRYEAYSYSGLNTFGGGANFFPGTIAGIADASTFSYYN